MQRSSAAFLAGMHQMQIDLPAPRSGQFLELSFRKLLKNCYDIADGSTPVRKKELVAWRTSPLFHHVGLHQFILVIK